MYKKEFFEHSVVFSIRTFREDDLIVKFLTPSQGMVTSFAFGGKKSRRRFPGCLEELSHVIFKVSSSKNGNYLYLQEGILIDRFSNIHKNRSLYGMAINCQKFLDAVLIGREDVRGIFDLYLELLKGLNNGLFNGMGNIPIFFRARVAKELGYLPRIESCNTCGRLLSTQWEVFFSPKDGNVVCGRCASQKNGFILFKRPAFELFCASFLGSPNDWLRFKTHGEILNLVAKGIGLFVETHLGIRWDRGRFRTK